MTSSLAGTPSENPRSESGHEVFDAGQHGLGVPEPRPVVGTVQQPQGGARDVSGEELPVVLADPLVVSPMQDQGGRLDAPQLVSDVEGGAEVEQVAGSRRARREPKQ